MWIIYIARSGNYRSRTNFLKKVGTFEVSLSDKRALVEILQVDDIQISMDGKGRALDNIFIERLWRSVKYEYIYLTKHSNRS